MNHYKVYRPPDEWPVFYPPQEFDFDSTEELLKNPAVSTWKMFIGFHQFSLKVDKNPSPCEPLPHKLIVEFNDGDSWLLAGFLANAKIDLPIWEQK